MEWWGYSNEHGWVVLDRSIPSNAPGLGETLLFLRCRDATTYIEKRKRWLPPAYRYAPNYLRDLPPAAAVDAAAEFEGYKLRWPEFHQQLKQEQQATSDQAEAIRLDLEQLEKAAVREKKKASRARTLLKKAAS